MKKLLLSTLIGTTLMSSMAGGSLAFASVSSAGGAENKSQSVKVSYESIAEIATADCMVVIPTAINFATDKTAGVDLRIDLLNTAGEAYTGNKEAEIGIESENVFNLKSGSESLPYSLTYDGFMFNDANYSSKIKLSSSKTSTSGVAKIKTTDSIKPGKYLDTLTYTVKFADKVGI